MRSANAPSEKRGSAPTASLAPSPPDFRAEAALAMGNYPSTAAGEIGGDLAQYIGLEKFHQMLEYVDQLYVGFGADPQVYGESNKEGIDAIRRAAAHAHLKLIDSRVRHMGTEKAYDIYSRIQHELEKPGCGDAFRYLRERSDHR